LGFLAINAARAVFEERSVDEILEILRDQDSRTYIYAALDTLEFVKRGGRIHWLIAGIADWLNFKPLISLHEGKIKLERIRAGSKPNEQIIQKIKQMSPFEELGILHANAKEKAKIILQNIKELLPQVENPWVEELAPVLGTHAGPGAAVLVVVRAKKLDG